MNLKVTKVSERRDAGRYQVGGLDGIVLRNLDGCVVRDLWAFGAVRILTCVGGMSDEDAAAELDRANAEFERRQISCSQS